MFGVNTRVAFSWIVAIAVAIACGPAAMAAGGGGGHGGGGGGGHGGGHGGGGGGGGGGGMHIGIGAGGVRIGVGGTTGTHIYGGQSHGNVNQFHGNVNQFNRNAGQLHGNVNQFHGNFNHVWAHSVPNWQHQHLNTLYNWPHGQWNHNWNWWHHHGPNWYGFAWWPGYYGYDYYDYGYGLPYYGGAYVADDAYMANDAAPADASAATPYTAMKPYANAESEESGESQGGEEPNSAFDFYGRALAAFGQGEFADASRLAAHAAVDDPRSQKVHLLLSLSLFATGEYRGAAMEAHAVAALGKMPDWAAVYGIYNNVDAYTKHLRALEKWVRDNGKSAEGHFLLGFQYLVANHREEAQGAFLKALKLAPRDRIAAQLLKDAGGTVPPDIAKQLAEMPKPKTVPSTPPTPPAPK